MLPLLIEPAGGLCNRMRAIDSAIALGQTLQRPVTLLWNRGPELNCSFHALFQRPSKITKIFDRDSYKPVGRLKMQMTDLVATIRGYEKIDQTHLMSLLQFQENLLEFCAERKIMIRTYSRFFPNPAPYGDLLPALPLQNQIENLRPQLKNAIGVHIRRTDNLQAKERSPLVAFIAAMEQALIDEKGTFFFVATDDPSILVSLQQRFGAAIMSHPKRSYARSNPSSIEDALVDLYCLASCRRIIGSYWSSFTDTAVALGKLKCHIAGVD